MNVLVIMHNGFEDIEALGTIALLRRAQIDVTISSFEGVNTNGRYDIKIDSIPFDTISNPLDFDMLFVPGGPHYAKILENQKALDLIKYYANNKSIAAICAAPTILGSLGLLKDKNYTCFSSMNADFGGIYHDTYVVRDQNIITGKSAAATIDFAFEIIAYLEGEDKALQIKNQIYYFSK